MKSIVGHPFDHHCHAKRDTITTNAIFSFNGRRLVTSLILVITTLILLILLIVNLNCNIFTEATVNTTSNSAPNSHSSPRSPTTQVKQSQSVKNSTNPIDGNGDGSIASSNSGGSPETDIVGPVGSESQHFVKPVLAKIKNSELDSITGESNSLSTPTTTIPTTINSSLGGLQMANSASANNISNEDAQDRGPCKTITSFKNKMPSNETSKYFDIDYASKIFEESMADKNAISLDHYLEGFKELLKFFHSLGSIFLFVTSDLENKIGLLENYKYYEKGECNLAYTTIQSAIEYETKENLLRDTKRLSGARTILRLHRALEFISMLMLNLSKLESDAETAPAAREAYSGSLAKHHTWTIRTIASFAMRTLPQKKILVESVLGEEHLGNDTATNEKMLILANVTENLFNVVDKYYEERNIKDLP